MSNVIFDISISLDGFITADNQTPEEPMGAGGLRLHDWGLGEGREDAIDQVPSPVSSLGALIAGRRTYDDSLPFWPPGGGPHSPLPLFVVTHEIPEDPPEDSVYTFVTEGIEAARDQAWAVAGEGDLRVMGGASLGRQFLAAGLLDEVVLHIVPVLLKSGTRMFEDDGAGHLGLEVAEVLDAPEATHVRYRVTG